MSQLIISATGQTITVGARVQAVTGSHTGTWWRLDAITHNGREYVVRVTRRVGRLIQRAAFPLHIFGLAYEEMLAWWRTPRHTAREVLRKVDEWLMAGLFALVPLGFFEQYHGAEYVTEIVHSLF